MKTEPRILARLAGRKRQIKSLQVSELDKLLEVPVSEFDKTRDRLVRRFRKDGTRVDIAAYRASLAQPANLAEPEGRQLKGNLYHAELRRIPPMERDEEFRMARRYELFRAAVKDELRRSGMSEGEADEWAGRPRSEILAEIERRKPRRSFSRANLDRVLEQIEDLRNLYIEGSLHLVLGTANRYRGLGVDLADLIQEGNASLFQAIEGFDWRRDVRFRTYAQYWVHQAVLKLLYNSSRTVRIPIWVQKLLGKIRRMQDRGRRSGREPTMEEIGRELDVPPERIAWVLATKRYAVSLDAEVSADEGGSLAQMLPDDSLVPVPDSIPEGDLRASIEDAMSDLPAREQMILRRRFGLGGGEPETLGDIALDLGITAERVRQLQNAAISRMKRPSKLQRLSAFVESS
ncbi:MAG: hypothetical protein Fur0037_13540 [Planctomycetota bacterium]